MLGPPVGIKKQLFEETLNLAFNAIAHINIMNNTLVHGKTDGRKINHEE
jgi:hypothetical protein